MANARHSSGLTPPAAPNPQPLPNGNAGSSGNAMASPVPTQANPAQDGPAGLAAPPAPSHAQTVAALRHFGMIEDELKGILSDPDLGKKDMKSKIIDGATKLVGMEVMTPAQAVQQLVTVPERPFEQKQWLEQHYTQAIQAQAAMLAHHQAAVQAGAVQPGGQAPDYDPNNHADLMSGLISQYGAGQSNAG